MNNLFDLGNKRKGKIPTIIIIIITRFIGLPLMAKNHKEVL